jgi:hypothetical protein
VVHGGCLGWCPIYRFQLTASGTARFEGICYTPLRGTFEAPLDSTTFARAARLLIHSDFFASDTSMGVLIDASNVSVAVQLVDGRRREVLYGPRITGLAPDIEALVAALPWHFLGIPPRSRVCAA